MRVSSRVRRWLTEPKSDPSVRVRFWREVEGRPPTDGAVRSANREIGQKGWAADLLTGQWPDGHWGGPSTPNGWLYRPKYIATNWRAIVLSDLGMTRKDPRIRRTAELILDRWGGKGGAFGGKDSEICVTGNAVRTLTRFGYLDHPEVQRGVEWIVSTQKRDGGWHCFPSRTGTLDAWEGLAAFAEIPPEARDPSVRRSIERGAEFYLNRHLTEEGRPRYPPWFRIHYPNHYFYDALVGLRVLTRLGYGSDPRLASALRWLESKRRPDGTWALDAANPDLDPKLAGYQYTYVVYPMVMEPLHDPSRWATVEALSVLARVGRA
jgi:Prenyltransferase and squalene oxidase repeat